MAAAKRLNGEYRLLGAFVRALARRAREAWEMQTTRYAGVRQMLCKIIFL